MIFIPIFIISFLSPVQGIFEYITDIIPVVSVFYRIDKMYKFEISSSGLENCSMILFDTNLKVKYELKLYITVLFSFNSDIRTLWKNKQYFRN